MSFSFFGLVFSACDCGANPVRPDASSGWTQSVPLPEPQSNNAVATAETEGGCMVYSLMGVDASLTSGGVHNRGFRWREGDRQWTALPEIPGPGRLAASAVSLAGEPYVLGGYSIDGATETSHSLLQRFNLQTGRWDSLAQMPVSIDDAVAVAWRDRYIVVVSGWHDEAAVSNVQIYDRESDEWSLATEFPGTPVFGHAGAIVGDTLLVVDGVASAALGFRTVEQAWLGVLDADSPESIDWIDLAGHTGPARYRAAAGATPAGQIWVQGGTAEPYNYDGLRYDNGEPSEPLATALVFDPTTRTIADSEIEKPVATMDHRALASCAGRMMTVGGMMAGPAATAEVWTIVP